MIYPKKIKAKKSDMIIKLSMFASIMIAILLLTINKLVNPNIHWAALANSGIIYIWVTVMYSIKRNTNIAGHILWQLIALSALVVFIDYKLGYKGWAIEIAIPIMIIIANLTMLILTIVSYKKYIKYAIYQLMIVLFSILPIFFMKENIIIIIASGISILNFVICLLLCAKDLKEAVVRKLHM